MNFPKNYKRDRILYGFPTILSIDINFCRIIAVSFSRRRRFIRYDYFLSANIKQGWLMGVLPLYSFATGRIHNGYWIT